MGLNGVVNLIVETFLTDKCWTQALHMRGMWSVCETINDVDADDENEQEI